MIVKCIGDPTFEFEIGQLEPSLLDSDFVTRLRDFGMKLKSDFKKKMTDFEPVVLGLNMSHFYESQFESA